MSTYGCKMYYSKFYIQKQAPAGLGLGHSKLTSTPEQGEGLRC